uniref:hypothetical protein n=1 Tax=uncultured Draconibacterium sp. TaxID=1573823 RepID=UPI003217CC3E
MKTFYHIIILVTLTFLLATPVELNAGIFKKKTDSIKIVIDNKQLVLPGESFKFGVISYHSNGKVRKTIGLEGGTAFWWRYQIEVTGGEYKNGKISVNPKLYPSKGKYISIKVWPKKQEELAQTVLVPLNYETEISFLPTTEFHKAPGCSFRGKIIARFDNGTTRVYKNLHSAITTFNFDLHTSGINQHGNRFTIDSDFRNIINHRVDIWLRSKRNPALNHNYSVLLDYKHNYNLSLCGASGSSGFSGSDGFSGFNGRNGGDGGNGGNGFPGYDGPDIGVWTDKYFDSTLNCNLLYVYAENFKTGKEYYYLINPEGGKLTVNSRGGSGGRGGNGGDGGNGGRGEDGHIWYETITKTRIVKKPFTETVTKTVKKRRTTGTGEEEEYEEKVTEQITVYRNVTETYHETIKHQGRGGNGGNGGDGGAGGLGGPGGWGGNIYLYFTDDARYYENRIAAFSTGGSGGSHGNAGDGGSGGSGGSGNPDGSRGSSGWDGPEAFGWADDGYDGEIILNATEEFFFYEPIAEKNQPIQKQLNEASSIF